MNLRNDIDEKSLMVVIFVSQIMRYGKDSNLCEVKVFQWKLALIAITYLNSHETHITIYYTRNTCIFILTIQKKNYK